MSKAKNYFTPFLLCPLIDMKNNKVLSLFSRTPTPQLGVEQSNKNNKNNNLIVYYNIVLEKKKASKNLFSASGGLR